MIAIAGGKGGSGKTTTALGLARAFARQGEEPLVVDCDVDMPDLHIHAGVDRDGGVGALADGASIERACVRSKKLPGVRLLPAGQRSDLDTTITELSRWHGPVLLDCPPGAGPDATGPLRHADHAVLVTTDQPQSLSDTVLTARSARQLGAEVPGALVRETEAGTEDLPAELTELGRVGTVPAPFTHPSVRATWGTVSRSLRPKI